MTRERLLLIDALINLALGVALLTFPTGLVEAVGFPGSSSAFYPTILGAVLLGIGLSLALEARRPAASSGGLGLLGAVSINMSAAIVLALWLLFGDLSLPVRGAFLLVLLILVLTILSCCEWYVLRRDRS